MINEQDKQRIERETQFYKILKNTDKNWTEDYEHENGNYQNKCLECNELFLGHKRRVMCKECFNKPIDWDELSKKKPPTEHENWAWQGCWADGEMTGYAKCMVEKVIPLLTEHERAQQELQAYKDIIKELLPLAEKTFDSIATHEVIYAPNKLYKEEVAEIIDKARKLIDTVTPTSNHEQS